MATHTIIPNVYYGLSNQMWTALGQLITRMRASNPALPSLPKAITLNRWSTSVIDALFAAVSAMDNKQPSKMFDAHNWYLGRDRINALVQLEQRISSLGF
jgi:hypothetical protein